MLEVSQQDQGIGERATVVGLLFAWTFATLPAFPPFPLPRNPSACPRYSRLFLLFRSPLPSKTALHPQTTWLRQWRARIVFVVYRFLRLPSTRRRVGPPTLFSSTSALLPSPLSCRSPTVVVYRRSPFHRALVSSSGRTGRQPQWIPLLLEVEATVVLARDRSTSLDGSHTLFPTFPTTSMLPPPSSLSPFRELRGHLSAVKKVSSIPGVPELPAALRRDTSTWYDFVFHSKEVLTGSRNGGGGGE